MSSCDGKTTCLFFSANWCRTCKTFLPQLIQVYDTLRKSCEKIAIVFISFDNNETEFEEHFKCMPWLAVPFDVNLSRRLSKRHHVKHLPSLIPLTSDEKAVPEDLVGFIEDYGAEAFPFTKSRRQELKVKDTAKLEGGNLEDLLAHEGRNHVIAMDGRNVIPMIYNPPLIFGPFFCAELTFFCLLCRH